MVFAQLLQGLECDKIGKRKGWHAADETMALPAPQQLLGNAQHASNILARVLLLGHRIEHARILACAARKREEKRCTASPEFRRSFIVCSFAIGQNRSVRV